MTNTEHENDPSNKTPYQCRYCDYPLATQRTECPTCHTTAPDSTATGIGMVVVGGLASLTVIGALLGIPFASDGLGRYRMAREGHVAVPYTEMPKRFYDARGYTTPDETAGSREGVTDD